MKGAVNMAQINGHNNQTLDLVDAGKQFYDEKLKAVLEPDHIGEYLAVEPISGRYFIGKDRNQVALEAINTMPGSHFYLMRIGYATTDKIGAYGIRKGSGE
jgi:hypothetical protein